MAVKRLRSLADAEATLWLEPNDPRLWRTIAEVWAAAEALAPMRFPAGVYKHRSIEALNEQTERWADERIRRARERIARFAHEAGERNPVE